MIKSSGIHDVLLKIIKSLDNLCPERRPAPMAHDSFRYEIKRLDILAHGRTAIVAGTGHIINDNQETIYQSSNVLINRSGTWKAVLSLVSGVTPVD